MVVHLGVIGDSDIPSVLLMSSHSLVLVAITAENPASQREDVGHGRFSVLLWPSQDILP